MKFKTAAITHIANIIANSLKPLLIIEYFYGIFRYRINGRPLVPIDLRMKILSVVISTFWITSAYVFCLEPQVAHMSRENLHAVNIIYGVPWLLISFHYALTNIMVILVHGKDNIKVIENFAKIDFSLQTTMNDGFYKASRNECIKLITVFLIFCITIGATNFIFKLHIDVLYMFIYFERKIEILVFCQILYLLRQRLQLIKLYFVNFITDHSQSNVFYKVFPKKSRFNSNVHFIQHSSHKSNKILDLAIAYDNVGELCKLINGIYNNLMFMTIISAFVFILVVFWTSLNLMKTRTDDKNSMLLLKVGVFSVAELVSIVFISHNCEKLVTVRDEIRTILNKLIVQDDIPKKMRYQAKVFIELTELWPLTFYISNMFQMNKNLVLKFISICTSYLIVVIQINDLV